MDERVGLKGTKILARVFGKRWQVTGEFYFPMFSSHHFYVHVKKKMSMSFTCQPVLRTKLTMKVKYQILISPEWQPIHAKVKCPI